MKISVVIPTHNRPQQLQQCLTAFLKVEYPTDEFEIIIGDDCSPQDLTPIIVPFQSQLNVQLVRNVTNSGPATARNTAAKLAKGDLIALTDDDCLPDPGWLTAFESWPTKSAITSREGSGGGPVSYTHLTLPTNREV